MEKTKEIIIKILMNLHKDKWSRSDINELFTIDELKSSVFEILDEKEIFLVNLFIFIEEINKRCRNEEEICKEDIKYLKSLWDNFDVDQLNRLKEICSENNTKNIITKMIILKNAYKKINNDFFLVDFEDYFASNEKLFEMIK